MEKCKNFLENNGWEKQKEEVYGSDHDTFIKDGCVAIDMNKDEIVFVGGEGDFLHLPVNHFALIGALICYHQLPLNTRLRYSFYLNILATVLEINTS